MSVFVRNKGYRETNRREEKCVPPSLPGVGSEGFLLSARGDKDVQSAVELLAQHLKACTFRWPGGLQSSGQISDLSTVRLVVADLRGEFTFEQLAQFEDFAAKAQESNPQGRVIKALILSSPVFGWIRKVAIDMGYAEKNHYILSDINHLLRLDPDFWIHGRVDQIGKQEETLARAISEDMSYLMEVRCWRFGWLEFDLFVREVLLQMGPDRILTKKWLPSWFKSPVSAQLQGFPSYLGSRTHHSDCPAS